MQRVSSPGSVALASAPSAERVWARSSEIAFVGCAIASWRRCAITFGLRATTRPKSGRAWGSRDEVQHRQQHHPSRPPRRTHRNASASSVSITTRPSLASVALLEQLNRTLSARAASHLSYYRCVKIRANCWTTGLRSGVPILSAPPAHSIAQW